MKRIQQIALIAITGILLTSCGENRGANTGAGTPIDSTNVNGTAPATYGGNNPANDQRDSNRNNYGDTGTKANNIHNAGSYDSTHHH